MIGQSESEPMTMPTRGLGDLLGHFSVLSADSRVLASSMVMVIGPTPPGTGVISAGDFLGRLEIDVAAQLAVGAGG